MDKRLNRLSSDIIKIIKENHIKSNKDIDLEKLKQIGKFLYIYK